MKRFKTIKNQNSITYSITLLLILSLAFYLTNLYNLIPKKMYTNEDFDIKTINSNIDFNNNGISDNQDFLQGAKIDANNRPKYDGRYYDGGYPPDNVGVCTDVIWRAFRQAGYSLKEMVNQDIIKRPDVYKEINKRDKNIDFRRVKNLRVFFQEYAQNLSIDKKDHAMWQAGDIIIFDNDKHIGIVSDKRNKKGEVYIIHNGGQTKREEDYLKRANVTAHFRFDAQMVDSDILVKWKD